MSKAKIAVFVSGGGTNLQALINAQRDGKLPSGEIALVISDQEGAYALHRAENAGIPTAVISKKRYGDADARMQRLHEALDDHEIDMIVLAGYLGIVRSETVQKYEGRIINIHPSLIPSFCGMGYYGLRVHEAALKRGVKVSGATVHLVTAGVDEGPILLQKAVEVQSDDTPESLQRRIMEQAEWILLPRASEMIAQKIVETKERNANE